VPLPALPLPRLTHDSLQALHDVFTQPPLPQRTKADFADKPFIKEVVKYGEMVQVRCCSLLGRVTNCLQLLFFDHSTRGVIAA
jgi:hypothetical protein